MAGRHWLMDIADWTYLNAHYFVTLAALVFIYLRRNDSFYFVRNVFMIAMGIAIIGYALYPTAPPRLMPEWGFTDSIHQFTGITVEKGASSALINLYAAVPSMHVCFALMVGIPMSRLTTAPSRADRVAAVPAADHVRRDRDRQPLPDRRVPRRAHRRRVLADRQPIAGSRAARRLVLPTGESRPPGDGLGDRCLTGPRRGLGAEARAGAARGRRRRS